MTFRLSLVVLDEDFWLSTNIHANHFFCKGKVDLYFRRNESENTGNYSVCCFISVHLILPSEMKYLREIWNIFWLPVLTTDLQIVSCHWKIWMTAEEGWEKKAQLKLWGLFFFSSHIISTAISWHKTELIIIMCVSSPRLHTCVMKMLRVISIMLFSVNK